MRYLAIVTVAVTWLLVETSSAHENPLHWLNQHAYRDPVTLEQCCWFKNHLSTLNHCHETNYEPKRNSDGSYTLQSGEVVPASRVQWSKDYNYYECRGDDGHLLCFFAVPLGN